MKSNNDYPVVVKSYELSLWYIQKLSTLPKNHRFTLGEQIQTELIGLLMNLTEAKSKIFDTVGFMSIGDNYRLTDVLLPEAVLKKKSLEAVPSWR